MTLFKKLLARRTRPSNLQFHESFGFQVGDGPEIWTPNRVVDQGLNYILNAAFLGEGVVSSWFIAPFAANVSPAAGLTAATFSATQSEFTNYVEPNRGVWSPDGTATTKELINNAAPAVFTVGSGSQTTIYGAGLVSAQAKSATSGVLAAAGLLPSGLTGLAEGYEVRIRYRLTASSS